MLCVSGGMSQLDVGQFYQFVDDGIDGEPGWRVNLQFACNVATVRHDRVYRKVKRFGNLLVGHTLDNAGDNFLLACA